MSEELADLAAQLVARVPADGRLIVAVAGAPGSGKSTLAEKLADEIGALAAVVPMDGFHLDNAELVEMGLFERKGAPETFDAAGLLALLRRIRKGGRITYPVFDRTADRTVPDGGELGENRQIVIVEGNYLLLDRPPWSELAELFDVTIWLDVGMDVLERRLIQRWLDHGLASPDARARALGNDLPNARTAVEASRPAEITLRSDVESVT